MKKRFFAFLPAAALLAALLLPGCGFPQPAEPSGSAVTDMLGRSVELPAEVDKVVAIGPGALRLYCYAGAAESVAGIEQMDTGDPTGKPYLIANPGLMKLPVIGPGGPNNAPDPEKILAVEPDVIFSTYAADTAAADELQKKAGIPVVALSYGQAAAFDPSVYASLELVGKITGQSEKAQAAVAFMQRCRQDLDDRTGGIADEAKPSVYVGALNMRGSHGIDSTQGKYALLEALHAVNVVDETGKAGSLMIDKEKLLEWDPDIIFVDAGGYASVLEDFRANRAYYGALSAFREGRVYSQLPYNYYSTNIDTAIADAYWLGKVIFPEAFADVEPEMKADEIYTALLGQPLYARMAKDFSGFGALAFE